MPTETGGARPAGGARRIGRLRELFVCGIADSFGMAVGWTVVVLTATARGGLAEAALYNAAMLGGVVLSAPAAGWLSRRLSGRTLLRLCASMEMGLRLLVLVGLVQGAPPGMIAVAILIMNVAGWVAFAGMRAEVNAVDASAHSMTRFAVCIAGVEAAGTALGATLPSGTTGYPDGWLLSAVFVIYPISLIPTILAARRARVTLGNLFADAEVKRRRGRRTRVHLPQMSHRIRTLPLLAGSGVMLIAAGPTLLAIPITEQLHGSGWVACAAVAFALGTLLSAKAIAAISKLKLPATARWPLWGIGMLAGWIVAPQYAPMVLVAQFAAGLSQTAFEGDMDARTAAYAHPDLVTRDLAYAASARALGGAISVRMLPMLVGAPTIGTAATVGVVVLVTAFLLLWTGTSAGALLSRRRPPQPPLVDQRSRLDEQRVGRTRAVPQIADTSISGHP